MLDKLGGAIERLLGEPIGVAAALLQALALVALLAAMALPLLRAAFALRAWRYGWETVRVVRCRRCGLIAADPETPVCPGGHPVRFPMGAARREAARRRFGRWRRAARLYPIVLPLAAVAVALLGYLALRVGQRERPLASLAAAAAYLCFIGGLAAASRALSPRLSGASGRLIAVGLVVPLALATLILGSFARSLDPPPRRDLGHFFRTPTAFYVSSGGRAQRVGPAAPTIEALLVEARAPAVGLEWEGLKGFRIGGTEIPWQGSGGRLARWLDHFAAADASGRPLIRRSTRSLPVPANVRIRVRREGDRLFFEPEG